MDYDWIRKLPWKERDPKNPPKWLQTAPKSHEDKTDMYLEPHEYVNSPWTIISNVDLVFRSFVLKVKAAGIVPTGQNYFLQFPQVLSLAQISTMLDILCAFHEPWDFATTRE